VAPRRPRLRLNIPPAARPAAVLIVAAAALWAARTQPLAVRFDGQSLSVEARRAPGGQAQPADATVRRVIDGDTIELADGRLVRYIGVDTPETRRKVDGRWVRDPEPMGEEATAFNRRLVEGKRVRLEYDAQPTDRYGRLLAYVYAGDVFVNAELLRQGYAQPLTIPPNVRHAEAFRVIAQDARDTRRGLWGRSKEPR